MLPAFSSEDRNPTNSRLTVLRYSFYFKERGSLVKKIIGFFRQLCKIAKMTLEVGCVDFFIKPVTFLLLCNALTDGT